MSKDGRIWLSHTSVELFGRCPRCFWLGAHKKLRQPEGIVSRLANRFDTVLKKYFDGYRTQNTLPPLVAGLLPGLLENPFQESYFVRQNAKYGFFGKLDECLVEDDQYIPVDFKTSSSDPREHDTLPAYQSQIDDYIYLQEKSGKKTKRIGYLVYFFPDLGQALHDKFPMVVHIAKLEGDPERTQKRIDQAMEMLNNSIPEPSTTCPFCNWFASMNTILNEEDSSGKKGKKDLQEELF